MSKRPIIGVTLDSEQPGGYSKYPWYAVRRNYADAIVANVKNFILGPTPYSAVK